MPGSKNPLGSLAFGRFQNKAVGLNLNSLPGCGEWGGNALYGVGTYHMGHRRPEKELGIILKARGIY